MQFYEKGLLGVNGDDDVYCSTDYMDPNSFTSKLAARALYDYTAQRDDELTLKRGALILNVMVGHLPFLDILSKNY